MNTERLRYFAAVAEHGSITAAAQQCFVSQTAITQQMNAFEKELGIMLLVRGKRGTQLTQAGKELLPLVQHLLASYDDLNQTVLALKQQTPILRIAYFGPVEYTLLTDSIAEFQLAYPETEVRVAKESSSCLDLAIEQRLYDLVLTVSAHPGDNAVPILTQHMYAAVSERNAFAKRHEVSLHELTCEPVIILHGQENHSIETVIMDWLLSNGFTLEKILFASSIDEQLLMVNMNRGITFLPESSYPRGIRLIPLKNNEAGDHSIYAMCHTMTPLIRHMIDCLITAAKKQHP